VAAIVGSLAGYFILRPVARRLARRSPLAAAVVEELHGLLKWLVPLLAVAAAAHRRRAHRAG
jgi:hypothetical protein